MAKTLSKALGTDIAGLAQLLRSKGRGKDTILAHINPQEAALLKRAGGSGDINPDTGLPEFYTEDGSFGDYGGSTQPDPNYFDTNVVPVTAGGYVDTASGSGSTQPDQSYYAQEDNFPIAPNVPQGQAVQGGYYPEGASVYSPIKYGAEDLNRLAVGQAPLVTTQQPSVIDQATGALGKAKEAIGGMKPETLASLGLAGGLGLMGSINARKAAGQAQAATAEQKALAQPYTDTGKQLMAQAQAGQMTPQSQAALNAAKAQIAQSVANRGGVGQQQAANQIAQLQANLLDNQYKYGLQVAQIGDNITLGAIKTGLQLDRQLQSSTQNFYAQLAQIAGGGNYLLPTQGVR